MKALSLTQPWAQLCVCDEPARKRFETRSWATAYLGPLLIHASKGLTGFVRESDFWDLCLSDPFREVLLDAGYGNPARLPRGEIVGQVELVAIWRIHADFLENIRTRQIWPLPGERERSFGDYTPGRYAWQFEQAQRAHVPIPARGALSLWEYDGPMPTLMPVHDRTIAGAA